MFINDVNITKHIVLKWGGGAVFLNKERDSVTCMSQFGPSLCVSSITIADNRWEAPRIEQESIMLEVAKHLDNDVTLDRL